jgi:hypothetical protein
LGTELARRTIGLVYGGTSVGLMGVLADAVLRAGGEAMGVIPERLMKREVGHKGLTNLHVVRSMHERKALMADLSDAFIAMLGGYGTLEEFCEMVTWSQLGLHAKPCGVLNVLGYTRRCWRCSTMPFRSGSSSRRTGGWCWRGTRLQDCCGP